MGLRAAAFFAIAALLPLALFGGSISGFTTSQVNYSGVVYDATVGPDGNVWFVDKTNDVVGRLDSSGNVTTFQLAKGTGPQNIVSGWDGNLWFTETPARIGRISTVGFLTEFPAPVLPGRITPGPDAAVWFFERNGFAVKTIVRVAADGTMTSFNMGTQDVLLDLITGADGNLWAAGINGASSFVRKISTAGRVLATYPTASGGFASDRMVLASDGNIWFTHGDAIDRITPNGVLSEFPASKDSGPFAATLGGDGNVYFVEYNSKRIAQVVIPHDGGSPAINESDQLSDAPGLIIAAPNGGSFPGFFALDNAPQPCAQRFIVVYDKSFSGGAKPNFNMANAFVSPVTSGCADLKATLDFTDKTTGVGTVLTTVTLTVDNLGPDDAGGITAIVVLSAGGNAYLAPLSDISNFQGNASGTTVTLTASRIPKGGRASEILELIGETSSDVAIAYVIVFAATPDPVPNNNVYEIGMPVLGKKQVLNPPTGAIVVAPVRRGG